MQFHGSDNAILGAIGMQGENPAFVNKDGTRTTLLHTGNKPTGTYTGNGDATQRTISVGGIGDTAVVSKQGGTSFVIVTTKGYIGNNNGTVICGTDYYMNGSNIVCKTDSALFNASGSVYDYRLL